MGHATVCVVGVNDTPLVLLERDVEIESVVSLVEGHPNKSMAPLSIHNLQYEVSTAIRD
jgi:hypothetical protein